MKIKFSKKQWESIGNKTGWVKQSQTELDDQRPLWVGTKDSIVNFLTKYPDTLALFVNRLMEDPSAAKRVTQIIDDIRTKPEGMDTALRTRLPSDFFQPKASTKKSIKLAYKGKCKKCGKEGEFAGTIMMSADPEEVDTQTMKNYTCEECLMKEKEKTNPSPPRNPNPPRAYMP